MSNGFWNAFLANFLSDLLVGGLFAAVAGVLLARWARRQERRDQRRAELDKAIRYLEMLKEEVLRLLNLLPGLKNAARPYVKPGTIRIPTPFWDTLQPSGELPKLINPQLLASLTQFYDHLLYAKQGWEWLLMRLVTTDATKTHSLTRDEIEDVLRFGLENALRSGWGLPDKLGAEIQTLAQQLESL